MNPLRWCVRTFGGQRWFVPVFKTIIPVDGVLQRATGARFGLTDVAGIDGLLLTTTGRRSGMPRTVSLIYAPRDGQYVVAGSNWGGQRHPAWSANLLTDPVATVTVRGRTERVKARLVDGVERERCWTLLVDRWPAYDSYADRAGREIRIFVLDPLA